MARMKPMESLAENDAGDEFFSVIMRLHIPYYEEARSLFWFLSSGEDSFQIRSYDPCRLKAFIERYGNASFSRRDGRWVEIYTSQGREVERLPDAP
jgi:hypothetical protein